MCAIYKDTEKTLTVLSIVIFYSHYILVNVRIKEPPMNNPPACPCVTRPVILYNGQHIKDKG